MQTENLMLRVYLHWILDYYKISSLEDGPDSNYMDSLQVGIGIVFTTLLNHGIIDLVDMRCLWEAKDHP